MVLGSKTDSKGFLYYVSTMIIPPTSPPFLLPLLRTPSPKKPVLAKLDKMRKFAPVKIYFFLNPEVLAGQAAVIVVEEEGGRTLLQSLRSGSSSLRPYRPTGGTPAPPREEWPLSYLSSSR